MFGFKCELFFSFSKFKEESNGMMSMRVTSIDKEPLSFISLNINHVLDILLQRLTLNIERESVTIDVISIHSNH